MALGHDRIGLRRHDICSSHAVARIVKKLLCDLSMLRNGLRSSSISLFLSHRTERELHTSLPKLWEKGLAVRGTSANLLSGLATNQSTLDTSIILSWHQLDNAEDIKKKSMTLSHT